MSQELFEIDGVNVRPSPSELSRRERDAEPVDDEYGPDSSTITVIAQECGCPAGLVSEILLCAAEHGLGAQRKPAAAAPADESKWRGLTAKLLKIIRYLKAHPGEVAKYAALHAWDIPDFDDLNGHLSQQAFADTIIVKYEITKDDKGREVRTPVYMTKAAVNNAVKDAQKHFLLPPRSDQYTVESCKTLKQKREGKLVKK